MQRHCFFSLHDNCRLRLQVVVCFLAKCCVSHANGERVIIIGAGAAGIAAATRLSESGVTDVVILEARDVVGGRMKHTKVGGTTVEVGCNWIQGANASNWLRRLNDRYGIACSNTEWENLTMYSESEHEVTWETQGMHHEAFEQAYERVEQMARDRKAACEEDMSTKEAMRMAGFSVKTKYDAFLMVYNFDYETAAPPSETSLQYTDSFVTYTDFGEEQCFINDQRGWSHMLEEMSSEAGISDKIKLNQTVRKIEYTNRNVIVQTAEANYSAEQVIVTVPVGVLKSDSIEFQPELPSWKTDAVQKFGMGTYIKIYLHFAEKFWPDTEFQFYISPDRGWYLIWQNLNYVKQHGNSAPFIYLVTLLGEQGRRWENQDRNASLHEIVTVLRSMYPGSVVPMPLDMVFHSWDYDPFSRGSYSYWPKGVTVDDHERLCAPVGRVWYAGEACHEKYRPFVHGALMSGNDTASDVLQCLGDATRCPSRDVPPAKVCVNTTDASELAPGSTSAAPTVEAPSSLSNATSPPSSLRASHNVGDSAQRISSGLAIFLTGARIWL